MNCEVNEVQDFQRSKVDIRALLPPQGGQRIKNFTFGPVVCSAQRQT